MSGRGKRRTNDANAGKTRCIFDRQSPLDHLASPNGGGAKRNEGKSPPYGCHSNVWLVVCQTPLGVYVKPATESDHENTSEIELRRC